MKHWSMTKSEVEQALERAEATQQGEVYLECSKYCRPGFHNCCSVRLRTDPFESHQIALLRGAGPQVESLGTFLLHARTDIERMGEMLKQAAEVIEQATNEGAFERWHRTRIAWLAEWNRSNSEGGTDEKD